MIGGVLRVQGGAAGADQLVRQELQPQRTHVLALHVGLMDTDMTAGLDLPKSSPNGALYAHFSSKDELVATAIADQLARQRATLRAVATDRDGVEAFVRF